MAWAICSAILMSACSETDSPDLSIGDGCEEYATVEGVDMSNNLTRALGMNLESFTLTVFNAKGKAITQNNLVYKDGNGWNTTTAWKMTATGNMNAVAVSPNESLLSNINFTKESQTFEYYVPTTQQTMLKVASDLEFSRKSSGGSLMLKFFNALSTLSLRSKNGLKLKQSDSEEKLPVRVYVKGVVVHNLKAHGLFTFNNKKSSNGTWTLLDDTYYNYAQELDNPVRVDSIQYTSLLDSAIVVLPQTPDGWAPAGTDDGPETDAISYADAAHKTYIELKCSMTAFIDNQEQYVWGDETTFPSVYLPFVKKQVTVKFANINTNGMYSILLQEGAVLDDSGHPIKPQTTNSGDSFQNAEFVNFATTDTDGDDLVDDWADPEVEGVTF
jgi:hypothetical protein